MNIKRGETERESRTSYRDCYSGVSISKKRILKECSCFIIKIYSTSFGKEMKCEACNELNKFNKTRARMLDSIYHMTLILLCNLISGVKTLYFCHLYATFLLES